MLTQFVLTCIVVIVPIVILVAQFALKIGYVLYIGSLKPLFKVAGIGIESIEVFALESGSLLCLFLWRMVPGTTAWFLAYKAQLGIRLFAVVIGPRGVRITVTVAAITTIAVLTPSDSTFVTSTP